jgi:hypothetical protein
MNVIARPVGSLPNALKARGWSWAVTRLIHGNSQCVGLCYDFVKKPCYLALGLEVDMGDGPKRLREVLNALSFQLDWYQLLTSAIYHIARKKQDNKI